MLQSRIVSVVGSSSFNDSDDLTVFLKDLFNKLGYLGFTLRTSGTSGIETLAIESYMDLINNGIVSPVRLKIFRPYVKYHTRVPYKQCYITINRDNYEACAETIKTVTPYWRTLQNQSKLMHCKNSMIIYGEKLNFPSTLLIVYDKVDSKGEVKGFSSSAIALAKQAKIPVFNFADESDVVETIVNLKQFLHSYGIPINQDKSAVI